MLYQVIKETVDKLLEDLVGDAEQRDGSVGVEKNFERRHAYTSYISTDLVAKAQPCKNRDGSLSSPQSRG